MTMIIILLVWLVTTGVAFRYTGHSANQWRLRHHSDARSICSMCTCNHCGEPRRGHWNYEPPWTGCEGRQKNDADWHGLHATGVIAGLVLALVWPVFVALYLAGAGIKASGVTEIQYFKPLPEIQTREERRAAREAAKDARLLELETRNAQLEKELEIGQE